MSDTHAGPQQPPALREVPVGIDAHGQRREFDSMGDVQVPADKYWGAQTQRSLHHFSIGNDRMPKEFYHAYGTVKKACALVNAAEGRLAQWKADAIVRAAGETIAGQAGRPLPVIRLADRVGHAEQHERQRGAVQPRHPVAWRHARQPAAGRAQRRREHGAEQQRHLPDRHAHRNVLTEIDTRLLPQVEALAKEIEVKAEDWMGVVKIGRTHLEDAVPLSGGSGVVGLCRAAPRMHRGRNRAQPRLGLLELAVGGTAVGTGLNAPAVFSAKVAAQDRRADRQTLCDGPQQVHGAQGSLDAMVRASAALRGLAVALMKIANDIRWLASGPRCGLGELLLPENEPGSSIMPGKVNPTQCEADRDDRHPGDRRRHGGRVRRQPGQFRAERDAAESSSTTSCTQRASWATAVRSFA